MKKLITIISIITGLTAFGQNISDSVKVIGGVPYKIVPGIQNAIDTTAFRQMYKQALRDSIAFDGERQMWIDRSKDVRRRLNSYRKGMQQIGMKP